MVLVRRGSRSLLVAALAVALALALGATAAAGQPAPADPAPVTAPAGAPPAVAVVVDIVPGLCPNHLRIDSPLTVPVGILGTTDFEVAAIEPATVRLSRDGWAGAVAPLDYAYKDLGSPLIGGRCACHELRGDGLDDLLLQFDIEVLGAALGLEGRIGEMVPLLLSGKLVTGESITGVDCALVIDGAWADRQLGEEIGFLADTGEQQADGRFIFAYFTDVSDHLIFSIYDLRGRLVARLVDMEMAPGIYRAAWNGTGAGNQSVAAGTYFARVSNSRIGQTRKVEIPGQ